MGRLARVGWIGTTVAVAAMAGAAPAARAEPPGPGRSATVVRTVDGDTLDVRRGGAVVRVRLLGVDTPETVDPHRPVECGGREAGAWLATRLPIGSTVTLRHDIEMVDRYGRELALVQASDGGVVNVEIARAGLGQSRPVGVNTTYAAEIQEAAERARQEGRGLYDRDRPCLLLPRQQPVPAPLVLVVPPAGQALSLVTAPDVAVGLVEEARGAAAAGVAAAGAAAVAAAAQATRVSDAQSSAAASERQRPTSQRPTSPRPPRMKRPDAAASERQRPTSPRPPRTKRPARGSTSSGGHSRYTGPRCYLPGGKTWRPC